MTGPEVGFKQNSQMSQCFFLLFFFGWEIVLTKGLLNAMSHSVFFWMGNCVFLLAILLVVFLGW